MKPGEGYDSKGVPIYPGDLVRSYHFTGARWRKKYYLYHVAVWDAAKERMGMVPTSHLEPTLQGFGGDCTLETYMRHSVESRVIHGRGPGDCLDYTDRPKKKPQPKE